MELELMTLNTNDNKPQRITGCHKTFWGEWLFERFTTLQHLVSGDTNVARSPKRFIQPERYVQG